MTSGLAAAALLVGPASTLGLDIAGTSTDTTVSQVTSTTDAVVQTTQQTVATVETTVQATVEETVQAATVQAPAAAPAPSAPAPTATAPVQETVSRTTSTVTKRKAAVGSRPTAVKQVAEKTSGARRSIQTRAESLRTTVAETATKTKRRTGAKRLSALSTRSSAAADEPAATCISLPLLDLLPATAELSTLLAVICTAGGLLASEPGPGTSGGSAAPAAPGGLLDVLGVALAGVSSTTSPDQVKPLSGAPDRASAGAAGAKDRHTMVAGVAGSGATRGNGPRSYPSLAGPEVAVASAASAEAAAAVAKGHHGIFSNPVDGASALALILVIDAALLAALLLWRLAQRWVVPRFA